MALVEVDFYPTEPEGLIAFKGLLPHGIATLFWMALTGGTPEPRLEIDVCLTGPGGVVKFKPGVQHLTDLVCIDVVGHLKPDLARRAWRLFRDEGLDCRYGPWDPDAIDDLPKVAWPWERELEEYEKGAEEDAAQWAMSGCREPNSFLLNDLMN